MYNVTQSCARVSLRGLSLRDLGSRIESCLKSLCYEVCLLSEKWMSRHTHTLSHTHKHTSTCFVL